MKAPDQSLIDAYSQSSYFVDGPEPTSLLIGQPAAPCSKWLNALKCCRAIIVTAFNPFSTSLSAAENLERNRQLEAEIAAHGLRFSPASGASSDGCWPAEPGFCVLDPAPSVIDDWMLRYGQYAVVSVTADDGCQLLWHPDVRKAFEQLQRR